MVHRNNEEESIDMAKMTKRAKVLSLVERMRRNKPDARPGDFVKAIEKTADLGTAAARTYYYNAVATLDAPAAKRKAKKSASARKAA
jgi:hypothetical protein